MDTRRSNWRDAAAPVRIRLYDCLCEWPPTSRNRKVNASLLTYRQGLYGALAELARRPEYIQPLREEVESVLARWSTTVAGCDQMVLLDSFLKECQRLHPPAAGMSIHLISTPIVDSRQYFSHMNLQCLRIEFA